MDDILYILCIMLRMTESEATVGRCTFGQRLHCDLLTVVAMTGSRHSHHPDTVLSVSSQIGDPVEIRIWRRLKLAHHL